MRRSLALLLVVFALLLMPTAGWALNQWTIVVYMVSDDDDPALENANIESIKDLVRVGPPQGCSVLVQEDRGKKAGSFLTNIFGFFGGNNPDKNYAGATRYDIQKGKLIVEDKIGEVNMGSPYCMWECLKWAAEKHPAKNYAFIVNSHGSGIFSWRGTGGTDSGKPGAVDFNPGRFVAYDDTDNDCLTAFEMKAVLEAFAKKLNAGRKLGMLGFDACMPGSVESLYQFRDVCDVLVGAADTTPITGFNYARIVDGFDPAGDAEALGNRVLAVHSRLGAWRSAKAQEVTFAMNNLAMELLKVIKEKGSAFSMPSSVAYGGKDRYWDVPRMLRSLKGGSQPVLKQMAAEVEEALKSAWVGSGQPGSISVSWPTKDEYRKWQGFYKALDFAQATKWDEMLDLGQLGQE